MYALDQCAWSWHHILIIVIIVAIIVMLLGMVGLHYLFDLDSTESFYAAALIMGGLSLELEVEESGQKIFIAFFTLISIGFYLLVVATIIACLLEPAIVKGFSNLEN